MKSISRTCVYQQGNSPEEISPGVPGQNQANITDINRERMPKMGLSGNSSRGTSTLNMLKEVISTLQVKDH